MALSGNAVEFTVTIALLITSCTDIGNREIVCHIFQFVVSLFNLHVTDVANYIFGA
jgi:hypothetical protein